jgi:hypothetical protein
MSRFPHFPSQEEEVVVAYFVVQSQYLLGWIKNEHEKSVRIVMVLIEV